MIMVLAGDSVVQGYVWTALARPACSVSVAPFAVSSATAGNGGDPTNGARVHLHEDSKIVFSMPDDMASDLEEVFWDLTVTIDIYKHGDDPEATAKISQVNLSVVEGGAANVAVEGSTGPLAAGVYDCIITIEYVAGAVTDTCSSNIAVNIRTEKP